MPGVLFDEICYVLFVASKTTLHFSFLSLSGLTRLGALIFLILGWFFHICLIFYKIICPILSLRTQHYNKWVHLCLLIVGKHVPSVLL